MPDHIHAPPVCGYAPNLPHAPSCSGFSGKMISCGTITDRGHPNAGQCLCRHEDAKIPEAQKAAPTPATPQSAPAVPAPAATGPAKVTKMPAAKPKPRKKKAKAAPASKKASAKKRKGRRK